MQMTNALAYNNDDIYIDTLETTVTQDRNNRFSAVGCQTDGARIRLLNLAVTHHMAPPRHPTGYCVVSFCLSFLN